MSDYKEPFEKVLNSNSLLLSLNVCIFDYGEPNRKKRYIFLNFRRKRISAKIYVVEFKI